jgi:hypothetical protein
MTIDPTTTTLSEAEAIQANTVVDFCNTLAAFVARTQANAAAFPGGINGPVQQLMTQPVFAANMACAAYGLGSYAEVTP